MQALPRSETFCKPEDLKPDPRLAREAAQATFDAALYELRTYGISQLAKPNCRGRLSDLSTRQGQELIAALLRLRAKYPVIADELIAKLRACYD